MYTLHCVNKARIARPLFYVCIMITCVNKQYTPFMKLHIFMYQQNCIADLEIYLINQMLSTCVCVEGGVHLHQYAFLRVHVVLYMGSFCSYALLGIFITDILLHKHVHVFIHTFKDLHAKYMHVYQKCTCKYRRLGHAMPHTL